MAVCKYIINQDLGVPRQRMIHAGEKEYPLEVSFVEVVKDYTPIQRDRDEALE